MPGMTNFGQRLSRLTPVSLSMSGCDDFDNTLTCSMLHSTLCPFVKREFKYVLMIQSFGMDGDGAVKMLAVNLFSVTGRLRTQIPA